MPQTYPSNYPYDTYNDEIGVQYLKRPRGYPVNYNSVNCALMSSEAKKQIEASAAAPTQSAAAEDASAEEDNSEESESESSSSSEEESNEPSHNWLLDLINQGKQ